MASPKIAVYSLPDLKNTTDDALPNYLNSLKFKQSHILTDVHLALGYVAVAIAAVTFYGDYMLGWDKTKELTLWAVVAYFILNGALTYWVSFVEKGKIFTGEINQTMVTVASSVTKNIPVYNLTVRLLGTDKEWKTSEISAPFTRWFDADGYFVAKPFQQWLASEVPLIGAADPQNATAREPSSSSSQEAAKAESSSQGMGLETSKKSTPAAAGNSTGARSRKLKS